MRDLAPANGNGHAPVRGRIVTTYDYTDGAGALLFQVVRLDGPSGKDFRQRRPDGADGWIWSLGSVRRVPYRLHELAEQPSIVWAEGEKDVDRLEAVGFVATTSPGGADGFREEYAEQLERLGVREVVILPDNDAPGRKYAARVAEACRRHGLQVRMLALPDLPPKGDVSDWLDAGHTANELRTLIDRAPHALEEASPDPAAVPSPTPHSAGELVRQGFDLAMTWTDGVRFDLAAMRDGRDGVRGELTVHLAGRRLSWGNLALSSTAAREALRKKLDATACGPAWGDHLEEAAWTFTQAARAGEPLVTLTGTSAAATRVLIPGLLYESEPTMVYADGDTGKSMFAQSIAIAVRAGASLPCGLRPTRVGAAAYLDWEGFQAATDERLRLLATGLGIDPPGILYKRMVRPLVDEAATLAVEFARRRVALVVVDSQMFALAGGGHDGASIHEAMTAFYTALRLFAPAASLVLSHITGADARGGGPARPFGGVFAYNGPRLIWEAKRDQEITDATAVVFTCRKANNMAHRPAPFGLRFQPGDSRITVYPFDLTEATPQAVAGAGLVYRLRLALSRGSRTVEALAEELGANADTIRRTLNRHRGKGTFVAVPDSAPQAWGLGGPR